MEVYLILEDKCSKLIRVTPTKGTRFFDPPVPFFWWVIGLVSEC